MTKKNKDHAERVELAGELEAILNRHSGSQRETQEKFQALGIPRALFGNGVAGILFSQIAGVLGTLMQHGARYGEAAEWIQSGRWPSSARASAPRGVLDRTLAFCKHELLAVSDPGSDQDAILDHLVTTLVTTLCDLYPERGADIAKD